MKIGYPCINRQLDCIFSTFRLRNYSELKLEETLQKNLINLQKILTFNVANGFYFFRISSDMVPFASHAICAYNWRSRFVKTFRELGAYIKRHDIRISMHPSQFVIINAIDENIVNNSIKELIYHAALLDAMELDNTAKIQIHVGGIYNDKPTAISRFINNYQKLPNSIKQRLVIENDDRLFTLADCLLINDAIGVPIIFDNLHHECHHNNESLEEAFALACQTWKLQDGIMMVDYSSQAATGPKGKHTDSLNKAHFTNYLQTIEKYDCDIMLEIKDKEASAFQANSILRSLRLHAS